MITSNVDPDYAELERRRTDLLPEPALAGVTAAWQGILRDRHPEYTGLVVEVYEASRSDSGLVEAAASDARPLACHAAA